MIYLDSSVALAEVLAEDRQPDLAFWRGDLTSSRLLQFELWNRLNAYHAGALRQGRARDILRKVGFVEMTPPVLARALLPFPQPVRTLDGLHLATMIYLRNAGETLRLASYDARLVAAAAALGFATADV